MASASLLDRIRQLRHAGNEEAYLRAIAELARTEPDDVAVRMAAAYACDRTGAEQEAIRHYDAAWRIGVPAPARREFLVGYGSTLRNVGRVEEAVAILGEAVAEFPGDAPLETFLALALHTAGHGHAALAALLGLIIDLDVATGCLAGHAPALAHYHAELLERAMGISR